ncbi:MAG: HU family DNA-binding protein [Rickettsiales bacterium]|jgi:DNA-binding protein HU-beta|nr:HU family DNA-binding protein [Rickettsiales bacterium]
MTDKTSKQELIDQISDKSGFNKADAKKALESVLDSISDNLEEGKEISLIGFGNFSISHRKERQGRNPQTGAEITIKASNNVSFKAGKTLKDKVNK